MLGSSASCLLPPGIPHSSSPLLVFWGSAQTSHWFSPEGRGGKQQWQQSARSPAPLPGCMKRKIMKGTSKEAPFPAQEGLWYLPAQLEAQSSAMVSVIRPTTSS